MGWAGFIAAFVAFFVSHRLPLRPAVRARLVGVLGRRGFTIAYSVLSLAVLAWLIVAAAQAPYVAIWSSARWQAWVPLVAMAAVCLILCFGIARPNPLSFGGARNESFDPAHPGIVRWMRHPLLVGLALWAGAHLVANGDLSHVILFGLFTGFAMLGMRIVDRRRQRALGAEHWASLRQQIALGPRIPHPESWSGVGIRLLLAVVIYLVLLALHPVVLGVSPLP